MINKRNKGITLIALVITIIVLLILAGVSITMLSGDNSILQKAGQAKENSLIGQEKEKINLAYSSALMKKLGSDVTDENLQTELDTLVGNNKTVVSINEDKFDILFVDTGHNYTTDGAIIEEIKRLELHITNYNELLEFANMVNGGESFKNYIVYLDNDITVEDDEWVIIGYNGGRDDPSMVFEGVFEGNNHTIKEVKVSTKKYSGLFYKNDGTIKNLNVEIVMDRTGQTIYGGICAENNKNILNCKVNITANIHSLNDGYGSCIGGIGGINTGTINNCTVSGMINARGEYLVSGGIVGENLYNGIVSNCKNEAIIESYASSGSSSCAGGIAGKISTGQVTKCINVGNLLLKCSCCGGIAGQVNSGIIDECVNKGKITSDDPIVTHYIAGLVARAIGATITNSYNVGNINLNKESLNNHAGSISGLVDIEEESVKIENCYNAGSVTISSNAGGYSAFGTSSSVATNCYYNKEISSLPDNKATGLTTLEMKNASFVSSLGSVFAADTNNINNGYPVLKWQNEN